VPAGGSAKEREYRAYSLASGSDEGGEVQLVITRAPRGLVSTYIHEHLKEGAEVLIQGPFGDFYLRDSNRDILFIATGSGLAPILSMLHQIEAEGIGRKATLFFGARRPADLYYLERLRDLERRLPGFEFIPTLSRPAQEDSWPGERGRVTDLILKRVPDRAPLDVYLCGAPAMVESCLALLKQKGIPETRMFYDKFE
jgi:Na+-transporting NADH:ubiquinone oxidoreductase subunit F